MKRKLLICSILITFLMLSMPIFSNIQAQNTISKETKECSVCPKEIKTCDHPIICSIVTNLFDRYNTFSDNLMNYGKTHGLLGRTVYTILGLITEPWHIFLLLSWIIFCW